MTKKPIIILCILLAFSVKLPGRNAFKPLTNNELCNKKTFTFTQFEKIPYRIQFKGIIASGEHDERFIFLLNNEKLAYVKLHEYCPLGAFRLLQYNTQTQTVYLEDCLSHQHKTLTLHKTNEDFDSYRIVLRNKKHKCFDFTQQKCNQQIGKHNISTILVNINKLKILVVDKKEGREPFAYYLNQHS